MLQDKVRGGTVAALVVQFDRSGERRAVAQKGYRGRPFGEEGSDRLGFVSIIP